MLPVWRIFLCCFMGSAAETPRASGQFTEAGGKGTGTAQAGAHIGEENPEGNSRHRTSHGYFWACGQEARGPDGSTDTESRPEAKNPIAGGSTQIRHTGRNANKGAENKFTPRGAAGERVPSSCRQSRKSPQA